MKEFIQKELMTLNGKIKTAKIKNNGEWIKKYYPDVYSLIISTEPDLPFNQKLFNILNDIKRNPGCKKCGSDVRFKTFTLGYLDLCKKCNISKPLSNKGRLDLIKARDKKVKSNLEKFYTNEDIELISNFLSKDPQKITSSYLIKHRKEFSKIIRLTSFLNYDNSCMKSLNLKERFYLIKNNLNEVPKCEICGKNKKFKNSLEGYIKSCSKKCSNIIGASNRIKTTMKKIEKKFDEIGYKLLEEYNGRSSYIKVSCNKGHQFEWKFWNGSWLKEMLCPKCYPSNNKSSKEYEIKEWLEKNVSIVHSYRDYYTNKNFYELDIFISDRRIGIEYDGLYWHSIGKGSKENSLKHLIKTDYFTNKGIQLLHIFENEWKDLTKQEIWKSIINSKLGLNTKIGARKCEIKEVSYNDSKIFLDENHLQGNCVSSIRYGLYYQNELVSLLTLSKSRFNKKYDWEITRYANKLNTNVIGGFSKLLKYFRTKFKGSIITYADKRYSTGNLYRQAGFKELKDSKPNYFYVDVKQLKLYSRIQFQKHKLKDKLKIFDPNKTEAENMFENGYRRI